MRMRRGFLHAPEFKELLEDHDAQRRPVNYNEGWDAAVEAILEAHPGIFEADSILYHVCVPRLEMLEEESGGGVGLR